MKRRRFLTLAAAFAGAPLTGQAASWTGRALGADAAITLFGPAERTERLLAALPGMLSGIEGQFSLYDPDSTLARLNRAGQWPCGPYFRTLLEACDKAWRLTDGLFDPTVQPLWQALARGKDPAPARRLIGWEQVQVPAVGPVTLGPGQQMTLNGIAQGFATETIAAALQKRGFEKALIHIGEHQALGGAFDLRMEDPEFGMFSALELSNRAVATSSPGALRLGGTGHILSPDGRAPLWSTVSIEADGATMADALSTAAVFMDLPRLRRLKQEARLHRITVLDDQGNLRSL
ncbi:FAD:protein FMN transferase [Mameliella sediminis]|uniref:FAD:protein FMN transferase n=1 Tax=Mameliella sediminis TaxID=2836866 RepID=UPI001C48F870|nr:FAD:protein FMN transferase [Mameliella sediminis]MBV7395202.1 FAD:protein FMN transferase [Mameliella sediminis]